LLQFSSLLARKLVLDWETRKGLTLLCDYLRVACVDHTMNGRDHARGDSNDHSNGSNLVRNGMFHEPIRTSFLTGRFERAGETMVSIRETRSASPLCDLCSNSIGAL
jgi:hypothetical protein